MPRQNRVTPFGTIIATTARGTLMGNRGCLHDNQGNLRRAYQNKRWISCLLDFKQRRRTVMAPGQYTELFFLDEATALAAGHRPCAECQRERFQAFRTAWATANFPLVHMLTPPAAMIDHLLHSERLAPAARPILSTSQIEQLPSGSFIQPIGDEDAYLVWQGQLLRWTPFGYTNLIHLNSIVTATLLTPPSIMRALAAGYQPKLAMALDASE
ncbi:MAG: hypothetical protein KF832_16500 [Caldilineaceae bacterium]|nr:hypothetical protein [Caldilineaceae bacterium]